MLSNELREFLGRILMAATVLGFEVQFARLHVLDFHSELWGDMRVWGFKDCGGKLFPLYKGMEPATGTLAVLDLEPDANWSHSVKYFWFPDEPSETNPSRTWVGSLPPEDAIVLTSNYELLEA